MFADDRVVCPACFVTLPPVDQASTGVAELQCPRCHHIWDPAEELQQTVEQTPMAKRRSSRPAKL
jgi:Zn-finger nucleic acid-binding protein